jgi:hypothetical protein
VISKAEIARRFVAIYLTLLVLAVGGLAAFYVMATDDVRTVTKTVPAAAPKDSAALVSLLGEPAQVIAGKDLNVALDGSECSAYEFADGVAFVCS